MYPSNTFFAEKHWSRDASSVEVVSLKVGGRGINVIEFGLVIDFDRERRYQREATPSTATRSCSTGRVKIKDADQRGSLILASRFCYFPVTTYAP